MSVLVAPPAAAPVASRAETPYGAIMTRVVVNLVVACAVPAFLLYVGLRAVSVEVGVLAALAWAYGATAWRRVTGRPTSGLLVLTVVILTARTVFTLSTGNTYVYFLEPIVTDALIGLLFLGSLASTRPLVARVAADFYPVDAELAACPRVRRLFARLTAMWGCVCLVKSGVGFAMLESLSRDDFVLAKTSLTIVLTVAAVAVTIRAALLVLRAREAAPIGAG